MKITGISFEQFLNNTKAAYISQSGSNVNGTHLIKQFLLKQLFPNAGVGDNEHMLHTLFSEAPEPIKNEDLPNLGSLVTINHFGFSDRGSELIIEDFHSTVCIGIDAINKQLRGLFEQYFPEHEEVSMSDIIDSGIVQDALESLFDTDNFESDEECEDARERMEEDLHKMDSQERATWLLDNIDIDDLTGDFFSRILHDNAKTISYENIDINY